MSKYVSSSTKIAIGAGIGFGIFWLTSHPRSKLHCKLPRKKYKNIQLIPQIQFTRKDKVYHFHHWVIFSSLYLKYFLKSRKFRSKILHGIMLGSILQGLTYKDRFKFRYANEDLTSIN